jgi:hypothetical protein
MGKLFLSVRMFNLGNYSIVMNEVLYYGPHQKRLKNFNSVQIDLMIYKEF